MKRVLLLLASLLLFTFGALAQDGAKSDKPTATAESDDTAKKATFRPTKAQITQGQQFLKDKKLYTGEADGKYNAETRTAIRAYQKENSLTLSGNFNQVTLEKMGISTAPAAKSDKASAKAPESKFAKSAPAGVASSESTGDSSSKSAGTDDKVKRPAPFQANKDQIMALQKVLKDGKMFTGEANGERSDDLKEAVKKYQTAHSLKSTGGINAQTLEKAGIALTDKQKEQVAAQAAYDAGKKN